MKADAERKAGSMRRIQKILFGTFLGGVLLCGVGAGTALVEYSSFTYAGEKKIGWEDLETKNLDFSFDRQKGSLIVDTGFWVPPLLPEPGKPPERPPKKLPPEYKNV